MRNNEFDVTIAVTYRGVVATSGGEAAELAMRWTKNQMVQPRPNDYDLQEVSGSQAPPNHGPGGEE